MGAVQDKVTEGRARVQRPAPRTWRRVAYWSWSAAVSRAMAVV